ncbi:MAG: glutamine synthetase, partial [Ignavibacteria bacterium]|nr:glutamine synthetase [Ignavibacteria bacterium]
KKLLAKLPSLPQSCVESAKIIQSKRHLYEHENIFPPSVIDYMAKVLRDENDDKMNGWLQELPAADRLLEIRKIMHKDLHKH